MTYPAPFTSTTFVSGEKLTAAKLFLRVLTWLNSFLSAFLGIGQGFLADAVATGTTTLSGTGTYIPASATVTLTLATQRRIRVDAMSIFNCAATAPARYLLRPAYNAGATAGTALTIGGTASASCQSTGTAGQSSGVASGTVLLAAGTYTFYAAVQRSTGGSTTDTSTTNYVAVYDAGSV